MYPGVSSNKKHSIKAAITTAPALKFYDVHKQVTLTCHASSHGLGTACLQDGIPVAFASRALTATQEKYAQIEKELLAVVIYFYLKNLPHRVGGITKGH